jgi:transmembrane sensor
VISGPSREGTSGTPPGATRLNRFTHPLTALQHLWRAWPGRRRNRVDETPFSLALKVELTWLSPAQRSQLEALVPKRNPLPQNVDEFGRYFPDRIPRRPPDGRPPEPEEPAPPPAPRWHWPTARAAAFVMLITTAFGIYLLSRSATDYVTGTGERRVIHLDDGSTLTMNTQSRVKVWFTHNLRDLQLLEGEALFTVARDPTRPFRVHVGRSVVEAVGTEFDVLKDKHGTKVSVVEGRVKIFDYQSPAPLVLNPNAVAWTDAGAAELQQAGTPVPVGAREVARVTQPGEGSADFEVDRREVTQQEIERHLAWTNGQLIFENATLTETVEEFNRYNRRKLQIGDPDIAQVRIGGAFRSNNVDDLLMELHSLFGIRAVPVGSANSNSLVIQLKRERPGPP